MRHATEPRRDRVALRWLGKSGAIRDYGYGDLRELTDPIEVRIVHRVRADALDFVVGLHGALGVDIPEAGYGKLATLDACVAYLKGRGTS